MDLGPRVKRKTNTECTEKVGVLSGSSSSTEGRNPEGRTWVKQESVDFEVTE